MRGFSNEPDAKLAAKLKAHVGTDAERWLFSVMQDGNKYLFHSPYEYEQWAGALIDQEGIVERWRAKMAGLNRKEKWPSVLTEHKEWIAQRPRDARQAMLDTRSLPAEAAASAEFGT